MNTIIHAGQATIGVCLGFVALSLAIAAIMFIGGVVIILGQMTWEGSKTLWHIARGKK